jgi:outer membrane biosynthesis protein TonB
MNATRVPFIAPSAALIVLLILACACTACSASAPPPGDAGNPPSEPAPAAPDTPAAETATPTAPLPEPTVVPTPAIEIPPPSPKPRPIPISKTPVKPMPSPTLPGAKEEAPTRITINALSRGKGVPAETREAFKQIRALLERQQASTAVTALQYQRIGLEGESRLCVEFRTANDAQAALAEIRKIAADVDLLNVVEAPCPSKKE